jgi:hypothetical protein
MHNSACVWLRLRYTNDPREALREFNFARKDTKWGGQAILHMVEVGAKIARPQQGYIE